MFPPISSVVWWPPTKTSCGGWVHPHCANCHVSYRTTHFLPALLTVLLLTHAHQRLLLSSCRMSALAPVLAYAEESELPLLRALELSTLFWVSLSSLISRSCCFRSSPCSVIFGSRPCLLEQFTSVFTEMCLILQTNKRKKFLMHANTHSLVVKLNEIYLMVRCSNRLIFLSEQL